MSDKDRVLEIRRKREAARRRQGPRNPTEPDDLVGEGERVRPSEALFVAYGRPSPCDAEELSVVKRSPDTCVRCAYLEAVRKASGDMAEIVARRPGLRLTLRPVPPCSNCEGTNLTCGCNKNCCEHCCDCCWSAEHITGPEARKHVSASASSLREEPRQ